MATAWATYPLKFEGGWRTDLGRLEHGIVAPGSATILRNYEPSINGGYSKILGYNKFDDDPVDEEEGNAIGVIILDESTCLARKGDKYYISSGAGWTEKLEVTNTGASKLNFDTFKFDADERVVIVDGFEDPAFYNMTDGTLVLDTDAPADVTGSTLVKVFKNHIFFARENILTFTAPFTYDDYDTGNGAGQINVGHDIVGLAVFRDQLIIFTTDSISRISGNTAEDFVLNSITDATGCLSGDTIQEVGGDILYLGPDGVRWLSATERNNDFGLERASSKIQSEITEIISNSGTYASVTIRSKNQYRLFNYIPSVPKNTSIGFLATKFSDQGTTDISWAEIFGMKVYAAHSKQFIDREIILFVSDDGYVYRMETGSTFDGEDFEYIFETPYFPITDPKIRKTIYKHSIYVQTLGTFDLTARLKFDYNISGSVQPLPFNLVSETGLAIYGEAVYGVDTYTQAISDTFVNQTIGSGFVIALRYEGTDSHPQFILDHAILEFMINERR